MHSLFEKPIMVNKLQYGHWDTHEFLKTCNKLIIFIAYPTSWFISVTSVFIKCENGPPT